MKTAVLLLCSFVCVLLAGCGAAPPVYIQKNFSLPEPAPTAQKCVIGNLTYYQQSYFIYHLTEIGDRVVYSPVGSYIMPENYTRWQYRPFLDKNDSLYNKTGMYIQERRLPNGNPVVCEEVTKIPVDFRDFIRDHEKLYRENLYKNNVNNSNDAIEM
jgi:hypothetical protein